MILSFFIGYKHSLKGFQYLEFQKQHEAIYLSFVEILNWHLFHMTYYTPLYLISMYLIILLKIRQYCLYKN